MRATGGLIAVVFLICSLGSLLTKAQDEQHPTDVRHEKSSEQRQKTSEKSATPTESQDSAAAISQPTQARPPDLVVRVEQRSDQADKSSESGWLRFLLGLLLPWPALVIAVLLYLFLPTRAPMRVEALLKPFQSLKLFGQEFVLNPQGVHRRIRLCIIENNASFFTLHVRFPC